MTKSDRIREFRHLPLGQIAERVGCTEKYVQVVLNQRTDARGRHKPANADFKYEFNKRGKRLLRRYRTKGDRTNASPDARSA